MLLIKDSPENKKLLAGAKEYRAYRVALFVERTA
jgi:hypothetical protein